jgi:hypothetical protein
MKEDINFFNFKQHVTPLGEIEPGFFLKEGY